MRELPKAYNPAEHEEAIYRCWEESGFFHPETAMKAGVISPDAKPYTIMMPPPNATGVLHMGHALMIAWQDLLVRTARMRGYRTLWLPGTDHAAIATQARVEKDITKAEGKSRHDLGRDELLRRIDAYVAESRSTILKQLRALGASPDWSREAFTLDEPRSRAVRTIFTQLYTDGLIYRDNRVVNWDPKGQTTISDEEIVYETRTAQLYTFRYSQDFPIAISTTQPETKVGDTAVAVHPDDTRYQPYIGKTYDVEFCGVSLHLRVIADHSVDPKFGTGALGVTPAHSMIDWEMAGRHDLPVVGVIDEQARMTVATATLKGKKVTEAREIIVAWLKDHNLFEKEEVIEQNVPTAERTGGVVQPLPKLQWFLDVNKEFTLQHSEIDGIASGSKTTLKEVMRRAVAGGQVRITPDHFEKVYFHWIDNLRDWCISRQIWYGHRLPVWYRREAITPLRPRASEGQESQRSAVRKTEEEIYVGIEPPKGKGWVQDEDTLDTWFSSGLWTFSTLGWPESTDDLEMYHPTTLIQPGTEILFFWVARMILMTGYALGQVPFRQVLLNGMVRDAQGRKFSKSLRNGGDPIAMAQTYGADAIRFYFVVTTLPGSDTRLHEDKLKGYQHFTNKLWNISRFILMNREDFVPGAQVSWTAADREALAELDRVVKETTVLIDGLKLHLAAEKLYHYVWHTVADKILEEQKSRLNNPGERPIAQALLMRILDTNLRLLHPFMPFVTEAIWQHLPQAAAEPLLMMAKWPTDDAQE